MQTSNFKKVAREAALKAGAFIRKSVGRIKSVRYKGEINIVTDIDRKAEDIIIGAIRKTFPRHNFLAEEDTYAKRNLDYTWIIDPIDGTTNFLHGFPFFCVSVALAYKDNIEMGVVYDPVRNELFSAERGKGSFLNRRRIHVSRIKDIKKAMVSTGFAYNVKTAKDNNLNHFVKFMRFSQAVRRAGSAALDLCYVACGRFDGFWELYLHPWDTAAGLVIVEEAGGKITQFDGSQYTIYDKDILATNSKLHPQMARILAK